MQTYFAGKFLQLATEALEELKAIEDISWQMDWERGVLIVWFGTESGDDIEFTHPKTVRAFCSGYTEALQRCLMRQEQSIDLDIVAQEN